MTEIKEKVLKIKQWVISQECFFRVFYFRAPGSLVVLSFPQQLNFSSVFSSL
jgi:hypothetical protein